MKQYLNMIQAIKENGTYKPAARQNMPGTQSLFGHQFRHNLANGFPLLTTKKMFFKGVIIELLWFLNGDTNIKYLVDNGVKIWNEDAYQYYLKIFKEQNHPNNPTGLIGFIASIEVGDIHNWFPNLPNYKLGDCGHQYGKVWRDFGSDTSGMNFGKGIDQMKNLIEGLRKNPESRRHIITAIDPTHDTDLALYWCHALFQFNCRPLTIDQRLAYAEKHKLVDITDSRYDMEKDVTETLTTFGTPKYYLDCQLFQRSADVFLGVPFNIASYALLIEIIAKMCNMIPGEFIHSFGDVHIYDTHKEAVEEQLKRTPTALPKLEFAGVDDWTKDLDEVLFQIKHSPVQVFNLLNYNPQESIKAELSTGLEKK